MPSPEPNPYLKTRIMTASSEELRLMLYDGALKFANQARTAMEQKQFEESYNHLMRAQKIVLELSSSLNHEVDPQLTEKLSAMYTFIYTQLVDANVNRQVELIDEAIKLLQFERETWQMLIKKMADQEGKVLPQDSNSPIAGAQQTAISSFSKSA
jgi:flagellar protein FliS